MNQGDIISCSNCDEKICRLTKDVRAYDSIDRDAFEFMGKLKDVDISPLDPIPVCPCCGFSWFRTMFKRS